MLYYFSKITAIIGEGGEGRHLRLQLVKKTVEGKTSYELGCNAMQSTRDDQSQNKKSRPILYEAFPCFPSLTACPSSSYNCISNHNFNFNCNRSFNVIFNANFNYVRLMLREVCIKFIA